MREAPAMFKRSLKANTKVKELNGNLGCNEVGGERWGSVLLLGRHLTVPNPQENKNKEKDRLKVVSLWSPRWNSKRTEQRTNYYMS